MSRPSKIQQRQTIVDQVVFGTVEAFHVAESAITLVAPCRRNAVVEFIRDPSIELIEIEVIQPVLEAIGFSSQPLYGLVSITSLIGVALTQSSLDEAERHVVQP